VSFVMRYVNSNVPELGGRYVMRTLCVSGSQRASTVCESESPAVKLRVTVRRLAVPSELKRHVVSFELADPSAATKKSARRQVPTS